jgi:hypothetical protein
MGVIQEKLLLPKNYIMWISKYPVSRLTIIFLFEFAYLFFRITFLESGHSVKRHKRWLFPIAAFANILLIYVLLFNVCVITNNKIIDRSFLLPQGRDYNYSDIDSIDTGVYGKKKIKIPFIDQSGEFYYIITLKDGTTIDLVGDTNGTRNNQEMNDVIEELDKTLVNMSVEKTAKTDNFELLEKSLDKIYSDKIKNILNNVK